MPENQNSTTSADVAALPQRVFAANQSSRRPPYRASRGGHAPSHVRQALLDTLDQCAPANY